jgi:hypothetical protein
MGSWFGYRTQGCQTRIGECSTSTASVTATNRAEGPLPRSGQPRPEPSRQRGAMMERARDPGRAGAVASGDNHLWADPVDSGRTGTAAHLARRRALVHNIQESRVRQLGQRTPCQARRGIFHGINWCLLPWLKGAAVGERRTPDACSGLEFKGTVALIILRPRVQIPAAPPDKLRRGAVHGAKRRQTVVMDAAGGAGY